MSIKLSDFEFRCTIQMPSWLHVTCVFLIFPNYNMSKRELNYSFSRIIIGKRIDFSCNLTQVIKTATIKKKKKIENQQSRIDYVFLESKREM